MSDDSTPAAARGSFAGGLLAALIGATCYGLNIPAAKVANDLGIDGPALIALRAGICLIGFLVMAIVWRWRPRVQPGDGRNVGLVAVLAAGVAIGYLSAVMRLPVSVAVITFYTFPLWIILYTVLRQGRSAALRLIAFVVAFSGILAVVGLDFSGFNLTGLASALAASLCSAALFIFGGKLRSDKVTVMYFVQWPSLIGSCALLLLLQSAPSANELGVAAMPIILSGLGYYFGFTLQLVASGRLNAAAAGLLFLFEPVVAITTAILLLGEPVTTAKITGVALVLSGLALDVLIEQRRSRRLIERPA